MVERLADAAPLARALVAGGLDMLEVTLRTPVALEAVSAMAEACPEAIVGIGTALSPRDLEAGAKAGARFAVSPGATEALLEGAEALPLLPAPPPRARACGCWRPASASRNSSRRAQRRQPLSRLAGRAAAPGAVLPDRRRDARERAALSVAAQCLRGRRILDAAQGRPGGRALGRDRASGAGGRGADGLNGGRAGLEPATRRL